MSTDTLLPRTRFRAPHRWGNRVWFTPSHRGAAPRLGRPLSTLASPWELACCLYQVQPVISWRDNLIPNLTMCVRGDPPISSSQICSQRPRFQSQASPQPGFPPWAFVSWHKADGYAQGPVHRPVAPCAQSCDPGQGKGSLAKVFGAPTSKDE